MRGKMPTRFAGRTIAPDRPTGIWRGRVTRVVGNTAFVVIPRLSPGREYGPAEVAQGPWTAGATTEDAVSGADPAHSHGTGVDLAKDDRVIVGFIEGRADEVVIIARLP